MATTITTRDRARTEVVVRDRTRTSIRTRDRAKLIDPTPDVDPGASDDPLTWRVFDWPSIAASSPLEAEVFP
jgi:hypothetical protein